MNKPPEACERQHRKPFVTCCKEVVYEYPFSCGTAYIGQPGQCINDRLHEHVVNVAKKTCTPAGGQVKACKCRLVLEATSVLWRHSGRWSSKIIEVLVIRDKRVRCTNAPVSLMAEELVFLGAVKGSHPLGMWLCMWFINSAVELYFVCVIALCLVPTAMPFSVQHELARSAVLLAYFCLHIFSLLHKIKSHFVIVPDDNDEFQVHMCRGNVVS